MLTNLIVLPALLLTFDNGKRRKDFQPLIENYEEFYQEDEDEEIDISLIVVERKNGEDGSDEDESVRKTRYKN